MIPAPDPRERLRRARLMLLFTPALCGGRDPLVVLERALPHLDAVQVRVKDPAAPGGPSPARALLDWTLAVLARAAARPEPRPLVLVNDRADVAAALRSEGVDGVHLGAEDMAPEEARALLGPRPLIGLSTHSTAEVLAAEERGVDYLGFGPIHPTPTKGYARGLGWEAAWIAAAATPLPVFPIGGIDLPNADELAPVGRAAVCAAVLGAADPGEAARLLRLALGG
ncbi:MAG: thiamine phosphate synthase [Planctomycetota bacterium]